MRVEITQAGPDRLSVLAPLFGRTFVDEPMMRWPLGDHGDVEERLTRCFAWFLESLIELGMVWEAGAAMGAAVWIPADQAEAWEEAQRHQPRVHGLTEDGGRRYDAFWEWVQSKIPDEPLWHLDSIAVEPELQGRGIGSALIDLGLARARADEAGVFLGDRHPAQTCPTTSGSGSAPSPLPMHPTVALTSGSCAGIHDPNRSGGPARFVRQPHAEAGAFDASTTGHSERDAPSA